MEMKMEVKTEIQKSNRRNRGQEAIPKHYRKLESKQTRTSPRPWKTYFVDFENGEWLGRTPFRWFLLLLFYMIFYAGVVGLVSINYAIFSYYLPTKQPRWYLNQPGLSMQPSMSSGSVQNIQYMSTVYSDIDRITDHISNEHFRYGITPQGYFRECNPDNSFGYNTRRPCFFLKLNKIIKFTPQSYNDVQQMPSFTPKDLKDYINTFKKSERSEKIWLGCNTKPHIDLQYLPHSYVNNFDLTIESTERYFGNIINDLGQISFFSSDDFSRIVAVRPINDLEWNKEYSIRCYAFAKNIIIDEDSTMPRGTVYFKLKAVKHS